MLIIPSAVITLKSHNIILNHYWIGLGGGENHISVIMFFNKYKQQYLHHTNALDSILKPIDIKYINHTPVAEVDNIGLFTPLPHTHHTHMPAGHSKHGRNYQIDEDPLQSPQTTETKEMGYRPLCSDRHAPSHKSPSGQCL